MSNFVPFNRNQSFLLAPHLKDWLAADDVAHITFAAVERVCMTSFQVPDRTGGKAQYQPRLMLALLIHLLCQRHLLVAAHRARHPSRYRRAL